MATIERGEFYMIAKGVRKGFEVTALKLAGMVKIYATKDVRVYTSEDIRGWISDGQMMVRRDVVKLVTGANRVLHHVFEGGDGNPFRVEPVLRDTDTVKAPIKRAKGTKQCAVFVTQSGVRIGIAKEYVSLLSLGEAKADYMDPARKMVTVTKNGEIIAVIMPMILEEANVKPEPDTAVPLPPATEAKYRSYARRKGTPNETTAQYVAQVRAVACYRSGGVKLYQESPGRIEIPVDSSREFLGTPYQAAAMRIFEAQTKFETADELKAALEMGGE